MKRVLVITYYWPPSGGSGVQRWVKFAKYLPENGWTPVIYTPENPELTAVDTTLEEDLPSGLEVIRRPIVEPYGIYRKLLGKGASTAVTEISSGKKTLLQRISLWIRANVFVPDPRISWVGPSVRFLKKYLWEHPVDAIVTTGPPHSLHLIGLKIHKATGLPWIPDFRDPWSRMYYLKYLPLTKASWRQIKKQEQAVLDGASAVLTVTPFVQREYARQTKAPVEMITNGFDRKDFEGPAPERDGHFNLVHTGLLAKDGNPLGLWQVLGEMASGNPAFRENLRIRLSGKVDREVRDAICAQGLEGSVVDLGYLDHAGAVKEQRAASVLLLPLRNDPQYAPILPGKLFEYLASGRPILGIGQSDGAMAEVIRESTAGITADWNDTAAMRAFLEKAFSQHIDGGVEPGGANIDKYSREATAMALAALLDRITAE